MMVGWLLIWVVLGCRYMKMICCICIGLRWVCCMCVMWWCCVWWLVGMLNFMWLNMIGIWLLLLWLCVGVMIGLLCCVLVVVDVFVLFVVLFCFDYWNINMLCLFYCNCFFCLVYWVVLCFGNCWLVGLCIWLSGGLLCIWVLVICCVILLLMILMVLCVMCL